MTETLQQVRPNTLAVRRYRERHPDRSRAIDRASQARRRKALKKEIYSSLGNTCQDCGHTDTRVLDIDHINGDGAQHRKDKGADCQYYRTILASIKLGENRFQLLCRNCNWLAFLNHKTSEVI